MINKKILIIEDEKILAEVLDSKLKKEGYQSEICYDGEAGLEKIRSWKPDLILLDIVMPKINGYEVLEKMKDEGISIPVIIISNSGQPVEIEKTSKLGAVDHLIKTQFDPAEVIKKIKKYLETKENGKEEENKTVSSENISNTAKAKILLVEDDNFLRSICLKKLVKEGFEVFEAIDGEKALKNLEKYSPNIVLLDLVLPTMDGFEILTSIRKNPDPKLAAVPIIILSNLGQDEEIKKAMDLGANMFLVKANFTTGEIVKKVKKLLNLPE